MYYSITGYKLGVKYKMKWISMKQHAASGTEKSKIEIEMCLQYLHKVQSEV